MADLATDDVDPDIAESGTDPAAPARQGVQSVEVGLRLVAALAAAGRPQNLKALAAAARMPAAKAHRYLVSLGRAGFVAQDPATGRYDLGPLALEVGLAALGRLDPLKVAQGAIAALRDRIDETICLTVWANRGATVVRWEESSRPVTVNVRIGSVLPLLRSASGRCFAAFLPAPATAALMAEERALWPIEDEDLYALLAEVRARGAARVQGDLLPGVSAIAAPVFDHVGKIPFVVTALGPSSGFDARWDGPTTAAVADTARALTDRLGGGRAG